jgi:hypothetical protein
MKPIATFLIILSVAFYSCKTQTREEKARKLIKDHLYVTLHDFKSYEVVKFEKLDSSFTTLEDDSLYKEYNALVDEQLENAKKANSSAEIYAGLSFYTNTARQYINASKAATDSAMLLLKKMKTIEADFKPEFKGWKMSHSYRTKNLSGNVFLSHYMYYFDKDLKKVVDHKDIGVPDEHD